MPLIAPKSVAPGVPRQLKQPSRKGKKAWRKHVDLTEIQEGLEDLRDEVNNGGIIAEKDSAELFTLDTAGDVSISKRHLQSSKLLRADEIIAQRSATPAVSMRKRSREGNTTDGIILAKRRKTCYVTHKDLKRLRNIADGRHKDALVDMTEASYDPWDAQKDIEERTQDPRYSFLQKLKRKVAPKSLKQKSISLAASGKDIPAVKKPDGCYSYNPVYTDYEERLMTEGRRELAAEERRLDAVEVGRLEVEAATKSAAEAEAADGRAELSEWEEDSAWEGIESGAEDTHLNAKHPERKTQAQRNRIRRRKEAERQAKMAADIKRKNEQIAESEIIAKAVVDKEKRQYHALLLECGDGVESNNDGGLKLRRRKLGKISLPEKDLELILPDELKDSLRLLKPEGNLFKERYRTLLIRGKVESRRPINFAKKAKWKATEKWTHKDFMLC